jgi:predicted porin
MFHFQKEQKCFKLNVGGNNSLMLLYGKRAVLAAAVTVALAAVSQLAQADMGYSKDGVDVEVYGILDAGVGRLEHSYSGSPVFTSTVNPYNLNSSSGSFNGIFSGGISMSRWGIKGEADLGSGNKAFFKLESAIDVNTGEISNNGLSIYNDLNGLKTANGGSAINGQAFSRAAYLGLSNSIFGSLEIGRTTNFSLDQVAVYDPVQNALLFSPLGFSGGIGGGLGATENTRLDNSIKYENKISFLDLGLQYKFAGSQSDWTAGSGYVAMLGYSNNGPLSLKGTYSATNNTVAWATQYSNVVTPDSNLQIEDTSGYMLSAMYQLNSDATLKAGYEFSTVSTPNNLNLTGIQNYYGLILPNPAQNMSGEQHFGTFWMGGDYKFTEAFDLGVAFYDINTYNSPEMNKQYIAQAYSILADYNLNKHFDTYAGVMLMSYSGVGLDKKAPTDAYSGNGMYGVGLRFKF